MASTAVSWRVDKTGTAVEIVKTVGINIIGMEKCRHCIVIVIEWIICICHSLNFSGMHSRRS